MREPCGSFQKGNKAECIWDTALFVGLKEFYSSWYENKLTSATASACIALYNVCSHGVVCAGRCQMDIM